MAEAIAVIGAVASIIQVINVVTKSIDCLCHIRNQWKDADLACFSLAAQLTTMRAALTKIHEWMDDSLGAAHHQLVMDLDVSISCCNLLILRIDSLLPDLAELTKSELGFSGKMKALFESRNIDEAQKHIERQTSALGLLLSACSCKTIAEQKTLLEKSKSRKRIQKTQLDSTSLWVHRDTDTIRSRFPDNLSKLSVVFPFDNIIFSSNVYERVFRGSLKDSLRRQQNGPLNETRKRRRDGKDTAAFLDFLGEEERPVPLLGTGIEVGPSPPAKDASYTLLMNPERRPWIKRGFRDRKLLLMSSDDNDTSWFLETIEQHITHPLTSQLAIDRTIVHCCNVLISAMKNFAIRPEKKSNNKHYTFLTENYPHKSLYGRFVEAMLSIWQDPFISVILELSAGLPSMDTVPHFLDALAQQTSSGHVPCDLREYKSDQPGIYETHLPNLMRKKRNLKTYHYVGMESKFGELGYVFGSYSTTLVIVNLSRYHQIEDNQRPRIMNDLDIFESAITWGLRYGKIPLLIFVRSATFKQDLLTHPLKVYFPDYSGQQAEEFISAQFTKIRSRGFYGTGIEDEVSLWANPKNTDIISWTYTAVDAVVPYQDLQASGFF